MHAACMTRNRVSGGVRSISPRGMKREKIGEFWAEIYGACRLSVIETIARLSMIPLTFRRWLCYN